MDLAEAKRRARSEAAKRRSEAHAEAVSTAPQLLAERGLPVSSGQGHTVSAFFPYKSEIDTRPLLARLAAAGWRTALPIVVAEREPLIFRAWRPGEETVPGVWDIPMPPPDNEQVEPDVLLIPMLAFDRRGYRLGYGGGFYDRTLALLRIKKPITAIGVAYSAQEVAAVPRGPFDQPLDYVMTEVETFKCG